MWPATTCCSPRSKTCLEKVQTAAKNLPYTKNDTKPTFQTNLLVLSCWFK